MPPIGKDEQTHALHALNVVECAKALVAAITRAGGPTVIQLPEGVQEAMRDLFYETSKLQVYETRAAARGSLVKLDDEQLSEAIKDLREQRVLTAGEVAVLSATPEETAAVFTFDDEPAPEPEPHVPAVPGGAPEPEGDDLFSI